MIEIEVKYELSFGISKNGKQMQIWSPVDISGLICFLHRQSVVVLNDVTSTGKGSIQS